MIGKSLVLFCVVFSIVAGSYVQIPQCGSSVQYQLRPIPVAQVVSSPAFSTQIVSSPVVQLPENNFLKSSNFGDNVISSGSVIATDGPETAPLPVIEAPSVTLPAVEAPVVALPSQPIPAPKVISQRCVCTKTVVKPQIIQRQVTVPKVQRYLKRTVTPVVENVSYKSRPVSSQPQTVAVAPTVSCYGQTVASNSVAYIPRNSYSRVC